MLVYIASGHLSGRSDCTEKRCKADFWIQISVVSIAYDLYFGILEALCVRIIDETGT